MAKDEVYHTSSARRGPADLRGEAASKLTASRQFVAVSAEWMTSDLSKLNLLVIEMDALQIGDDAVLALS